jgi:hypothetical protein
MRSYFRRRAISSEQQDRLPFRFCGHKNNCDITVLTAWLIESDGLRNSITRLPTRPFVILNLGEPTYPAFLFHEICNRAISLPARVCPNLVHQRDEESHHE